MSIQLNPLLSSWLTLLLVLALLGALVHGTVIMLRKQVVPRLVWTLGGIRLAIFFTFLAILLQPAVSYTTSVAQLPELLVLIDTSPSMSIPAAGGNTRLDEVKGVLKKGEFAESLRRNYRLQWFTFDGTATHRDEADLDGIKPAGVTTQFADSIDAAGNQARGLGRNPQRLLLVSDGNDRGQADPVEAARRFGLTVDVLAPSATTSVEPAKLEIAEVQSARRVLLGSDTHFRATLSSKQPASQDQKHVLRVTEDGKKILEQPLVLKAGRTEKTIVLGYRPSTPGLKQYEFQLDGPAQTSGKPYQVSLQVLDNKYEVLILEDRWRWEYKYLHRLFEDDPSFRFSAMLARGSGAFVQFASPDRRINLIGFPQNRTDLEGFDTFVLGDVDAGRWPPNLAADLARQVTEEGRSLVVIAGSNIGKWVDFPALHALLPVELSPDSGKPVEGPVEVRMRADSSTSPFFFQLGDDEKLLPLDRVYPVLRKKAGATVLLETAKERNSYGPLIVIAEHTIGRGRVLFVASDTLWKWQSLAQSNEGPTPYSIFWQQAFRTMAPARSNVGAVNLWLTPSHSRCEVGRPVLLHAEMASNRSVSGVSIQGMVTLPDNKTVPLVFTTDPANPKQYSAEFACTVPGLHRISASLAADGKLLAEGNTAVQSDEPRGEQSDVDIDMKNLARIAQATGGKIIDSARSDTWPSTDVTSLPKLPQFHTIDLWSNFSLLLLLCVLLGVDWFTRLFRGLVAG